VAEALVWILNKPVKIHKTGEIDSPDRYHIVGEVCWSNLELAIIIADIMDKPLKYRLVDFHKDNKAHDIHYGLEDNKLRPGGWKQSKSTLDCLEDVVKWQKENSEWIQS